MYREDISWLNGKDIKAVLQVNDVKNFVRECFHNHFNNEDFFNDTALMDIMFYESDPVVIQNYFSDNPDNL